MATLSGDGLLHGKADGLVYYVVNGKQRVRGIAKRHKAPKKGSGVYAARNRFGEMSKVAKWLLPVLQIGLHKDARRMKMFHHNVFLKVNKKMFVDGKVDYEHLVVSRGCVPTAGIKNLTVSKGGVIDADFNANLETDKAEEVFVAVLCPDMGDCKMSALVDRREGHVKMRIPRGWLEHELHGYAVVRRTGKFTSPSEYIRLNGPAEVKEVVEDSEVEEAK